MSKWLKWALIALAVVFIIAIAIAYGIVSRYDFNTLKPKVSQAVLDATGRELAMGGDIKLDIGLKPALVVDNVSFQNAPWGSRPHLASVKSLEVQVALVPLIGGNIEVKRLALIEPDILIETDPTGKSNLAFEKKDEAAKPKQREPAKAKGAPPDLTLNDVRIENGHLTYKNGASGKTYMVALESLSAQSKGRNKPIDIKLKGSYNRAPVESEGTIGPLRQLAHPGRPWPVKLTAKTAGAVVTVDGAIKDVMNAKGMDLNVTAEGKSANEIAKIADLGEVPETGPFKISVKLSDPSKKTYRLSDLNASFGASDLAGSAEIALADERPFLTATLTSKNLDLRPLSSNGTGANGAAKAPAKPKGKKGRVFPDQPLPLDALRKLDARATLNVNRMLLPQAALNDLTAAVTLKDGILTAKPVTATIGGGSFDGVVDLRAGGDVADLDLRLDVAHLDLARMLKELNAKEIMQGSLNANINVSGRGQSVAALMGSLDGKAIVQIGDGRINNEYIDLLGADVGAGVLRLINPFAQKASHTDLDCFISRFDINDGIAESTVLVLNTSKMSVIGAGRVNLKTEGLDLSLKPSPKQGSATSVGGVSLNLGELVKPFKLSGTLANPKLAIDPTQTAVTIGKAAGGMALLGPIGAGAAMAGSGEGVSCAAAADAAKTGVKVKPASESSKVGKTAEDVANGAGEAVKGAGRKLRELFGR